MLRQRTAKCSLTDCLSRGVQSNTSSQYITDGITEGLINKLSEISALRVIARNSVFKFKGKEADAQAAGRDLKVEVVLTGRIAYQADAATISTELVSVSDGSQIWGRQFRYSISGLSRAQDELASAILDKLKLGLNRTEGTRLAKPPTDSSEAYHFTCKAAITGIRERRRGLRRALSSSSRRRKKTRISPWRMLAWPMRTT
jgi:TolB-like protein